MNDNYLNNRKIVANTLKYFNSEVRIKDTRLCLEIEKEWRFENVAKDGSKYLDFMSNDDKLFSRAVSVFTLKKACFLLKNNFNGFKDKGISSFFENISES
jgi:hypothetical protein